MLKYIFNKYEQFIYWVTSAFNGKDLPTYRGSINYIFLNYVNINISRIL